MLGFSGVGTGGQKGRLPPPEVNEGGVAPLRFNL